MLTVLTCLLVKMEVAHNGFTMPSRRRLSLLELIDACEYACTSKDHKRCEALSASKRLFAVYRLVYGDESARYYNSNHGLYKNVIYLTKLIGISRTTEPDCDSYGICKQYSEILKSLKAATPTPERDNKKRCHNLITNLQGCEIQTINRLSSLPRDNLLIVCSYLDNVSKTRLRLTSLSTDIDIC